MPKTRARRRRGVQRKTSTRRSIASSRSHSSLDRWGGRPLRWERRVVLLVTEPKKGWKWPFGKKDDERGLRYKKGSREAQTKTKGSLVKSKEDDTTCEGGV